MPAMTAEEAAEWGKTLDFPTVWAAILKTEENMNRVFLEMKESAEEDRKRAEEDRKSAEEGRKRAEEDRKRAEEDRIKAEKLSEDLKEMGRQLGGLHNSMGDLVETLFAPHLGEKFDIYNYNLRRIYRRVYVYDDNSQQRTEIDILLSNTTLCLAMEVKRWLETKDQVDYHIKRMQLIRQYPPAEVKGKKLIGAIAGAVITPEAREYAEQNGFFVLELTGEDYRLLDPPEGFQPREW